MIDSAYICNSVLPVAIDCPVESCGWSFLQQLPTSIVHILNRARCMCRLFVGLFRLPISSEQYAANMPWQSGRAKNVARTCFLVLPALCRLRILFCFHLIVFLLVSTLLWQAAQIARRRPQHMRSSYSDTIIRCCLCFLLLHRRFSASMEHSFFHLYSYIEEILFHSILKRLF